jgi:hypothetical protein
MSTVTHPLPAAVQPARRWRAPADITALGRIEGRRLLLHPIFLIGVLLSVVLVYAGWTAGDDSRTQGMMLSGYALLPLAAATAIAANLAALRSRRDNTDELYGSLPRPRSARAAGQLLGLAWTLPVSAILLAGAYVAFRTQHPPGLPSLAQLPTLVELAQGPLVVIALGAVGILLARIAPSPIVVPLLVIAGFFAEAELTYWIVGRTTSMSPAWVHWLAPLANDATEYVPPCAPGTLPSRGASAPICDIVLAHDVSGMAWHVSHLAAMILLTGAAALVRTRRRLVALISIIPLLALASALAAG